MDLYDLHPDPEGAPYRDWAFDRVPELVWETYHGRPDELRRRESALAREAKYAYAYAAVTLRGPFPAGEPAIATSAFYAYYYARHILGGRFPAGEPAIARDPVLAANYAHWHLANDAIRK
jgi:hypothetical protein